MPKIKTHRGAAKRFKVAKSGRIKYQLTNKRHILTEKDNQAEETAQSDRISHRYIREEHEAASPL